MEPEITEKKNNKKKWWKIALISLGSLLGVAVVAIVVALWLVLTPARLTSIVNKLSDKFILCESHFDNVDLTLFKTFPYVGLQVEGVCIVNPMDGAPSDTLAKIKELDVGINIREYLKNKNIEVTKLVLDKTTASLFIDKEGKTNFDIFPKSEDTSSSEPFKVPDIVSLNSIKIKSLDAEYVDLKSNIDASLKNAKLDIDGKYEDMALDADMKLCVDGIDFAMKGDSSSVVSSLQNIALKIECDSKGSVFDGDVNFHVKSGRLSLNGQEYVNDAMKGRTGNLMQLESELSGDLKSKSITLEKTVLSLKDYEIKADGNVTLPHDEKPMAVDVDFETNTWNIDGLLAMLPAEFTKWKKSMNLDADIDLSGNAKGNVSADELPAITANLKLQNGRFSDRTMLPYNLTGITANIGALLNINEGGVSDVDIHKLTANTGRNHVELSGHIADLLGKMQTNANLRGNLYLADFQKMIPDDINLLMDGKATLNLNAVTNMQQLQNSDFANMKLNGTIALADLNVEYDTIYASIPNAKVGVHLPATMKKGLFEELLSATIDADAINANLPNSDMNGILGTTMITAAISDIFDSTKPLRIACDFDIANIDFTMDTIKAQIDNPNGTFAMMPNSDKRVKYVVNYNSSALSCRVGDSLGLSMAGITIKGTADYDSARNGVLQQWSPNLDIDFKRGYIGSAKLPYTVQIPDIKFNYKPERCEISNANIVFGSSDFYLSGAVTGLEKWLVHQDMLKGDLYFTSNYTNVDDLLEALSGMGSDADSLEAQRKEENLDTSAHPFIVPRDVDFTLHTRIKDATAFQNDLREVAGDVQIRDGVAVLNQVGFVCKAARMQLTGMYKTPRINHIFVGMDFHLLDINIQELIEMIPYVDTLVPLLADLEGAADFHFCAETYLDAFYKPKMSTLRGAAALIGQNLVVLDNKDIDRIAKMLQLKSWREDDSKIHIDSLDVEMTVFRKELEVYPFLLNMHKYSIVAEGRHDLSNNYDYHVELVETPLPVRLAVDIFGTMPNLQFSISPKLRYKNLYRPAKRKDVDERVMRLKTLIRQSLESNVKQDTREYEGLEK